MANQKQRKRRDKEKRHGIELVEIDEEGNERVLDASDLKAAEPPARVKSKGSGAAPGRASRRGEPQPPSWQRAFKRAAIFGPLFFIFVLLTSKNRSLASAVLTIVPLLVLFVPMSYYMDRFAYRMHQKRLGKAAGPSGTKPGK
jgi:hypothetical protein